jgi:ribosomal protein L11 methyltransferase
MQWLECTVPGEDDPESICNTLAELGVGGMSIENEQDFHDFLENNRACWDYVDEELEASFAGVSRVKFWLSQDEEGESVLAAVRGAGFTVETRVIADEDWENNWKQYYKPLPIGEKLVVVPAWEETPQDGRVPLRLDPGLIFGTGSHATTRMCLEAIESLAAPDKRVLDLGCGSGILSIGALVLGCKEAVGCDIDPKAPDVALSNAALNGIGEDRFRVYAGDVLSDRGMRASLGTGFDIVLANIVADVIRPLAPLSRDFLAEGATFVTSGIIEGRQDEIEAALKGAGYRIEKHLCEEEWHCFVCKVG